jgi:hypothetical protein
MRYYLFSKPFASEQDGRVERERIECFELETMSNYLYQQHAIV